jgi:hypothetical protein
MPSSKAYNLSSRRGEIVRHCVGIRIRSPECMTTWLKKTRITMTYREKNQANQVIAASGYVTIKALLPQAGGMAAVMKTNTITGLSPAKQK